MVILVIKFLRSFRKKILQVVFAKIFVRSFCQLKFIRSFRQLKFFYMVISVIKYFLHGQFVKPKFFTCSFWQLKFFAWSFFQVKYFYTVIFSNKIFLHSHFVKFPNNILKFLSNAYYEKALISSDGTIVEVGISRRVLDRYKPIISNCLSDIRYVIDSKRESI